MKVFILTLFPEMFDGVFNSSILGKSLSNNIWSVDILNIRDFSYYKNKEVDDKTYGGGRGRVIKPDVLSNAIDSVIKENSLKNFKILYTSPRGKKITQERICELSLEENIIFICGRYEGIDQRIIDAYDVEEFSIGDFVLTGGEIPVMAIVDSVVRMIPGTIKNSEFDNEESFNGNLLEYDQFTTPNFFNVNETQYCVPEILKSGNHEMIKDYRTEMSKKITLSKRPDLWSKFVKSCFQK